MAKRATYDVSDAMLDRFVKWTHTEEFTEVGVYRRIDAVKKWMRDEGFAGSRPMFALLHALHERMRLDVSNRDRAITLIGRLTVCIERQYEQEYEVAEAARTLLRSMTGEIESIANGGD